MFYIKLDATRYVFVSVSGSNKESAELDVVLQRKIRRVQAVLSQKLAQFLHTKVYYFLRRILSAEIKHLYKGNHTDTGKEGHWT